jgi:hypothetical protein
MSVRAEFVGGAADALLEAMFTRETESTEGPWISWATSPTTSPSRTSLESWLDDDNYND